MLVAGFFGPMGPGIPKLYLIKNQYLNIISFKNDCVDSLAQKGVHSLPVPGDIKARQARQIFHLCLSSRRGNIYQF